VHTDTLYFDYCIAAKKQRIKKIMDKTSFTQLLTSTREVESKPHGSYRVYHGVKFGTIKMEIVQRTSESVRTQFTVSLPLTANAFKSATEIYAKASTLAKQNGFDGQQLAETVRPMEGIFNEIARVVARENMFTEVGKTIQITQAEGPLMLYGVEQLDNCKQDIEELKNRLTAANFSPRIRRGEIAVSRVEAAIARARYAWHFQYENVFFRHFQIFDP